LFEDIEFYLSTEFGRILGDTSVSLFLLHRIILDFLCNSWFLQRIRLNILITSLGQANLQHNSQFQSSETNSHWVSSVWKRTLVFTTSWYDGILGLDTEKDFKQHQLLESSVTAWPYVFRKHMNVFDRIDARLASKNLCW